MKALSTK